MADLQSLEINDTGFLKLPSGPTSERPNNPSNGIFRFNTDENSIEFFSENFNFWFPANPRKIGTSSVYYAPSARFIKEHSGTIQDGFYWIKTPNMSQPETVWCDMRNAGGGWMLCFLNQAGPLEQQPNTFYNTLYGLGPDNNLSPYRHNNTRDYGNSSVWPNMQTATGVNIMKQYNTYNSSNQPINYTYNDTNPDGILHTMGADDRQVYDILFMGNNVSALDLYSTDHQGSPTVLNNTVSLWVDRYDAPANYDYGSTQYLITSSNNRGFANDGANDEGQSPQMQSWGARHWIAYSGDNTGKSRVRCQYKCWGSENVWTETGIFIKEHETYTY